MRHQVVVAGAGPAGIATAVGLVRRGLDPARVLVLDRARFPRAKPCGGGLTGHAAAALAELGLSLRVPSVPCPEGRLVYGRIRRTVRLPRPVEVVRREEFDADLVEQARALGLEVREGDGVRDFTVEDGGVVVTTGGEVVRCQVLVGADGAGSLVRRRLEDGKRPPLRLARLELPAPARLPPATMIYDFSPFTEGLRGYVWLFPVPGGRVNVGVMHDPAGSGGALGGRALDAILATALRRYGVSLPGPARGWPAWGYDPRARVAGPRLLCVGDAAGINGFTGEGIAVGLAHGPLAAAAICDGLASGDLRFAGYARALRRALVGRELALDRVVAALLYRTADFRPFLSLILGDETVRALYAARVSGTAVLSDRKPALVWALARHLFLGQQRMAALDG
jgi:flavin-dependent dehydrogenase